MTDAEAEDAAIFEVQLPSSPYPGLRPFQKSEWPIFFGREGMTDTVINLLLKQHLLVVHGASGNGKSSLIRAGVLARLEQEHARSGIRWRTCATTPGNSPLINVAKSLAGAARSSQDNWIEFRRGLNHGRQGAQTISRLLELNDDNRLCLLIDQFEEIFHGFGDTPSDQAKLLSDFLVGFSEAPPDGLFVLITMRSEFLGLCSRFSGLAETINRAQYLLPRMNTENLLRAVREPAVLYGGNVTEQLAEKLVIDARSSEDELPLIQHGLSQLWAATAVPGDKGPILDISDYPVSASLSGLISDHADRIFNAAIGKDSTGVKIVEELFRALTAINSEGHAIRRQQTFAELVAVTGATEARLGEILDAFRQPGVSFITPYLPASIAADTLIDISHEALIRHWKKISDRNTGWLQREFRDGLIWQALRVQAESFILDPANLLSAATTETRSDWLKSRSEAWARRYGGMWSEVVKLIDASRDETERQQRLEKQQSDAIRQAKYNRNFMLLAVATAVLLGAFAYQISVEKREAVNQAETAKRETDKANIARADATEAQSRAEAESQQRLEAQARAEKAAAEAESARKEAVNALRKATEEAQRADQASERATKFQSGSAESYVASHGNNRDTLTRALTALADENDPIQVAFFGQVVGQMTSLANPPEIRQAAQTLIAQLSRTQDPASASAITQALTNLAANLNPSQAQAEAEALLETPKSDDSTTGAIALTLGTLGSKLNSTLLDQVNAYLFSALMSTSDSTSASAIAAALSGTNWSPTPDRSVSAIAHVMDLVAHAKDPTFVGPFGLIITAMAAGLGRAETQNSIDAIRSLDARYSDILKPAMSALTTRLGQLSLSSADAGGAESLLKKMIGSRWCASTRPYSLQMTGDVIVWRDSLGSLDFELVLSSTSTDAQTKTQKSNHIDGKNEPLGTIWTYRLAPGDKVNVRSTSGKVFTLVHC